MTSICVDSGRKSKAAKILTSNANSILELLYQRLLETNNIQPRIKNCRPQRRGSILAAQNEMLIIIDQNPYRTQEHCTSNTLNAHLK